MTIGIHHQHLIIRQTISHGKILKPCAIIPAQAIFCGKPDKTIFILAHIVNTVEPPSPNL